MNNSFLHLLTKTVSSSRSLSLSLDDSAKLEACIRGQTQSQSFSLCGRGLKDSQCVP